jgi:RNA polymerase sigma-70 factor (ECF subfamily)
MRPLDEKPAGAPDASFLETRDHEHWLEPIPDARVLPAEADPFELTALRQSIRLAFVAALQHLPPRQRAALLLTEVLGLSASEVAECLEISVAAVNSALQRARATLAARNVPLTDSALEDDQSELLDQYVDAFQRYDVDALVGLLRNDVAFSMPPFTLWLQGRDAVRTWLVGPGAGCRGSRLIRVNASAAPAFAQYRPGETEGTYQAWALIVLDVADGAVSGWTAFLDTERLFPLFGLSLRLAD